MIVSPEAPPMAGRTTTGLAVNCSQHEPDGGAGDVAFTAGVITVAAAFCVISVVSLCHCVRHALAGGGQKAPLDALYRTEEEVEMAELRHFPLPHAGQVPRVRTPPSPSPSPMKFLLSPPEARLSQTHLMSSRVAAPAPEREPARLTRSLPSLSALPDGRAAHGAVEHYVEMALVAAMTASSTHDLQTLAPDSNPPESPSPPPAAATAAATAVAAAAPPLPPRESSRGRRRLHRKRYPRTPLPRGALVAAPRHGSVDTDYQSAYAPSLLTDSDDLAAATATATAAERVAAKREGSELILVSRRALERMLRRPLTAAELHVKEPSRDQVRGQVQDRDRADTLRLSGLQPLESTGRSATHSRAARSGTAGALADTEETLGDTADTLGDTTGTLVGTAGILGDTTETLETLGDTGTLEDTAEILRDTVGTSEERRRDWIPEPASPEWDASAEPPRRPLSAPALVVSPRSDSVV